MKQFAIYKADTGEIVRNVTAPDGEHLNNLFSDERAIEGDYLAHEYIILNGVPVLKDPAP